MASLIDLLEKRIGAQIVQKTNLFDTESFLHETAYMENYLIAGDIEGRYSLSGATDGEFSAACINNTFDFVSGQKTIVPAFLGLKRGIVELRYHKVNIGHAFKRETALKMIENPVSNNRIVIYIDSCVAGAEPYKRARGAALKTDLIYKIGVMFKVKMDQFEFFGCTDYDNFMISLCANYRIKTSSLVRFDSVVDRWTEGKSFINDYLFTYTNDAFSSEELEKTIQSFNARYIFDIELKENRLRKKLR